MEEQLLNLNLSQRFQLKKLTWQKSLWSQRPSLQAQSNRQLCHNNLSSHMYREVVRPDLISHNQLQALFNDRKRVWRTVRILNPCYYRPRPLLFRYRLSSLNPRKCLKPNSHYFEVYKQASFHLPYQILFTHQFILLQSNSGNKILKRL